MTWSEHIDGTRNWNTEMGYAQVEKLGPGKWRWEAHVSEDLLVLERDGWWGDEKTEEDAKSKAEAYLKKHLP